ncbi:glycerol dehydrogenase [Aestuariirhabdus litorea]|uniref:Glycerol dehydrogenase n=1 Tax=Aestuariirhabdus litorea TaxID=2528527 RepID=A0A3P3VSB6_9GAMM|nr:glycerol dehydrogenase [Aestuariirhabdus litorea]RRJ84399.1 iron-containing alcohol dehydrogenase [Aestuariirhabdus litorea]RWW97623.1 iron-containing alcohol dehydrogenase [Endozoicomonadaceae bacterium GTF-13]
MSEANPSSTEIRQPAPQGATRIFGSPGRYVQAAGLIDRAAEVISTLKVARCAILCSARSQRNEALRLQASLHGAGIETRIATFGGECSLREIEQQVAFLRDDTQPVDALIALGGGKTIDAGKSIAYRLQVPSIVMPTLASNDAPCSAISVIYTPEGVTESFEVFEQSPALVLVDTAIIAEAPARFLVAGIGDAMATWYEARACQRNPAGITPFGVRPTLAGTALAEVSARALFDYSTLAVQAVESRRVNEALEHIVEANTLLSGLGFESGGIAAAHAVAQAFTLLEEVDHNYLHGEMVAYGVLTQLLLEGDQTEAERVGRLFAAVGLPVNLAQLGLEATDSQSLATVVEATLGFPFIGNMPLEITAEQVQQSLLAVDQLGTRLMTELGDLPYARLHGAE